MVAKNSVHDKKMRRPKESVLEFFAPLRGSGIRLERRRDYPRKDYSETAETTKSKSPSGASDKPMKITVTPLTTDHWPDLETIFKAKGCSIARWCWCMAYRRSGAH